MLTGDAPGRLISTAERASAAVKESRPEVGSSMKSTWGLVTSARPMLVRLACPPAQRASLLVPGTSAAWLSVQQSFHLLMLCAALRARMMSPSHLGMLHAQYTSKTSSLNQTWQVDAEQGRACLKCRASVRCR